MSMYRRRAHRAQPGVKRATDVVAALLLLIGLSPVLGCTAAVIKWRSGSPVFFLQPRPGKGGKIFKIVKFRTMDAGEDQHGSSLPDAARLTPVGRVLRSTSLDELPELWNVLRGDMSLVGPRPLLVRYTPFLRGPELERLSVRPGITGWAQVNGRNNTPWAERLALDVWYVRNMSLGLDAKILALTLLKVLRGDDVVVDAASVLANLDDERRHDVP